MFRYQHPSFDMSCSLLDLEAEALFQFGLQEGLWLQCERPGYWNGYSLQNMKDTIHNVNIAFPERDIQNRSAQACRDFYNQAKPLN